MEPQAVSIALTTGQERPGKKIFPISSKEQPLDKAPQHLDVMVEAMTCPIHGNFEVEKVFIGGRWRGDVSCPTCTEEARAKSEAKAQRVRAQVEIDGKLKRSGIPKRFMSKTFDNYRVDACNGGAQKMALEVCRRYAHNFQTVVGKGTCLVLCGRPGTGKNHLAAAIANTLISSGEYSVVFTRVYSAIRAIKETFRQECSTTERDVLSAFINVDLLILDEVGVQFNSEYERMMMFEIINSRYDEVRPTILISNLNAKEAEGFVGERVWDRLFEDGGVILPFDWESERRVKK